MPRWVGFEPVLSCRFRPLIEAMNDTDNLKHHTFSMWPYGPLTEVGMVQSQGPREKTSPEDSH